MRKNVNIGVGGPVGFLSRYSFPGKWSLQTCSELQSGVFFFFQAEDGIRGGRVTGVQTCALPISPPVAAAGRGYVAHRRDLPARRRDRQSGVDGQTVDLGCCRGVTKSAPATS